MTRPSGKKVLARSYKSSGRQNGTEMRNVAFGQTECFDFGEFAIDWFGRDHGAQMGEGCVHTGWL